TFPGGHLTLAGANSASGLASMPIRDLYGDELDRWPLNLGDEGDPWEIASKRTTTFWNRTKVAASTPTVKGTSRIEALFLAGAQRRYLVPCPHCQAPFVLRWALVQWPDGQPALARVVCPVCERAIEHAAKPWMLTHGAWRATRPEADGPA